MEYYVGVDLGATNVRAVVGTGDASDVQASLVGQARGTTPGGPDGETVTTAVLDVVRAACDDAGVPPETVVAAGVGSIGPLDLESGAVVDPVNFPSGVDRVALREPLEALLETDRVSLLNDTSAGVVGERAADPESTPNLVYLTISTGIGAGACVDGRLLAGANGNAGELGHTIVDPGGEMVCGCGGIGHWEAYCGGRNIPAYARSLHAASDRAIKSPVDTTLPLDSPEFTAADVFAHAPDDAFAGQVVDRIGEWNAIGVANLVHSFAPSRVVIGGAVAYNNPEQVLEPIRTQLPAHLCIPTPAVELTRLGADVVVLGALAWAQRDGPADPSA